MAVTLVQQIAASSASASATVSATLGAAPTSGNFLICAAGMDKAAGTITPPTGFTEIFSNSSSSVSIYVGWKVSNGTETTVTVGRSISAGSAGDNIWYAEYSDSSSGAAWQIAASATNPTAESSVLSWSTGTTGAAARAGYALAFMAVDSSQSVTGSPAWSNSYSSVRAFAGTSGKGDIAVASLSSVAQGATTSSTFSYTGTADQLSGAVVVFSRSATSTVSATRATTWNVAALTVGTLTSRWVGAPTTSGFTVAIKTSGALTARLKVSTAADLLTSPVYSSSATPDAQGYAKLSITSLAANTQYYYGVEVDSVLNTSKQGKAKTLPTGQASFSFAFGSCSSSGSDTVTTATIRAKSPLFVMHLGDIHYDNPNTTDPTLWRDAFDTVMAGPNYGAMLAECPTIYTWSDHDFSGNNSYSGSTGRNTAPTVYRQVVPHFTLPASDGGVFQTWAVGRVRFIQTDLRYYRTINSATDNSSKTMMGAEQKQWFKDTITNATESVIIWGVEDPWIDSSTSDDCWGRYTTERAELVAWINGQAKPVYIVSGDMHAVACDDGTNSPGGIPVAHGAPWRQAASQKGGPYQQGPLPASGTASTQQYGWMDVTDNGSSITLVFTAFSSTNTVLLGQTVVYPTTNQVTSSRATTWTTKARTTGTRATLWAVSTAGTVTGSRSTSWTTKATVARTRATTWAVTATPTPGIATASRATTWHVRGRATGTRSTTWQTRVGVVASRPTLWRAGSLVSPSKPNLRLRAYSPNGGDLGDLPTPTSFTASYILDDVGALTVEYSPRAPRAELLGQPCEIAVEVSPDGGRTWVEPINSRFVYLSDGMDPLNRTGSYSVEARSYVWRLSKAVVVGGTITGEDENAGKRPFLSATPGKILKTLIGEAQTRGALTGIDHSSFTSDVDSSGTGWTNQLTIYYEPGVNLLTILQDLSNQGFVNFRMQGRALQVYNAETIMAIDRTVGTDMVTFRPGRDLTEAPFRRTWEGLADTAFFAGAEGKGYTYTNPSASKPWGQQEIFISNGSVSDTGTMAALTQAELSLNDTERVEYTRGLDFAAANALPLINYSLGDYVWSTVDNTVSPLKLRVRQLTLVRGDRGAVSGNAVLNDRFVEADLRQRRRIEGISNGAAGPSGDGGGGTGSTDKIPPEQVEGLVGSSSYYMAVGGYPQSAVSLTWATVSDDDLDHYEIWARPYGSALSDLNQIGTSSDPRHDEEGYVPESKWWFSVVAVDESGNRGPSSDELGVTMAKKTSPPQAPSTPTATAKLGMVSMSWDGQPSVGEWPGDFDYVQVHCSTINNFTPSESTLIDRLYGAGTVPVVDQDYGVPLFFKLVAVDTSGLESLPSQQATATPTPLVGTDIDPTAFTFDQIPFKDVGNFIFDGSFEDFDYRTDVDARSSAAWGFSTSDKFHGAYSATVSGATNPSTTRTLVLMAPTEVQQMRATEKIFCRFAYKGTSGANGSLRLVAEWTLSTGVTSTTTLAASTINNTWQQSALHLVAPTNTVTVKISMELTSAATTGTWWVDAVEVRRTIGTAIIEDAAISNAQIADLAVNSAKIADLEVGKLTSGSLTADLLLAGKIQTASSGSRLEMTGTGLRLYNGSTLTGHWNPAVGQLRVYNTSDITHSSSTHGLQFGDSTGANLAIDNNEIMARNNGSYATLLLNREGGNIWMGGIQGGFNPDGSDTGMIPQDGNHSIHLRANVLISNVNDAEYESEQPPLMIGRTGMLHLYFDSNEIGAADGDAPSTLFLNPARNTADGSGNTHHNDYVVLASQSIGIRRGGSYSGGDRFGFIVGYDGAADVGMRLEGTSASIRDGENTSLRAIIASAFNTSSGHGSKKDITDFEPLAIVRGAKSQRWKYKQEIARDDEWHFGPMVENLPAEMRKVVGKIGEGPGSFEVEGYDLAAAVGVLWEAVRVISNRLPPVTPAGPP